MPPIDDEPSQKGKKQANFSNIEIEQIAKSWIACSTCSTVGAQQKSDVYWNKIKDHFHAGMADFRKKFPGTHKQIPRSLRSLGSKWGDINHDCAKYSGAVSTITELNESGTSWDEILLKANALYQQTHKKGLEFTFEGAWMILKDSPKWQIAARLNEKHLERAAKRKKGKVADASPSGNDGDEESPGKEARTPEMVTERTMGNKKAKEIAAIEKKGLKKKDGLAESTLEIAAAMNRRAEAMESVNEIQLFSLDLSNLDERARQFMLMKRKVAEIAMHKLLAKNLQFVEPFDRQEAGRQPRDKVHQENIDPEESILLPSDVWANSTIPATGQDEELEEDLDSDVEATVTPQGTPLGTERAMFSDPDVERLYRDA